MTNKQIYLYIAILLAVFWSGVFTLVQHII